MADDKTKQGKRDDSRIDVNDPDELQYAAEQANVTPEVIKKVIQQIGSNSRERVLATIKERARTGWV